MPVGYWFQEVFSWDTAGMSAPSPASELLIKYRVSFPLLSSHLSKTKRPHSIFIEMEKTRQCFSVSGGVVCSYCSINKPVSKGQAQKLGLPHGKVLGQVEGSLWLHQRRGHLNPVPLASCSVLPSSRVPAAALQVFMWSLLEVWVLLHLAGGGQECRSPPYRAQDTLR